MTENDARAEQGGVTPQEEEHAWHALPAMIGEHIVADDPRPSHSGGYMLDRADDGDILIYRQLEMAKTEDDLEETGNRVQDWYDYVTANELVATIPAPDGGWGDEIEKIPESIWDGWR